MVSSNPTPPADLAELGLTSFTPRPALRVPETRVLRPKFPAIEAHNHLGRVNFHGVQRTTPVQSPDELLAIMEEAGVTHIVDLDGHWGDTLKHQLARFQHPYPDHFVVFSGIDYANFPRDPNFGETEARRLRESATSGARGLKVWKLLGLESRDQEGDLIPVDDARLDPLWETAAELDLPVLIHSADPVAFFQPLDAFNERWEELNRRPDWHFYPTRPTVGDTSHPDFPSFDEVIEQFGNLLTRHPNTTFIGAHVGCFAEDLAWVGKMMDACPNFHIDFSARIAELGRQPYSARDFFIRYQDRILFGTDSTPNVDTFRVYYRFLESRDEYFNYDLRETPGTGRWQIYGLYLPDDVLYKVYRGNAERVILKQHAAGGQTS